MSVLDYRNGFFYIACILMEYAGHVDKGDNSHFSSWKLQNLLVRINVQRSARS